MHFAHCVKMYLCNCITTHFTHFIKCVSFVHISCPVQQCEAHWMSTLCCVFHNRGVIVGSRRRWRYCPCTVHSAQCTVHTEQWTVQICITTRKLVHNVYRSEKKQGMRGKATLVETGVFNQPEFSPGNLICRNPVMPKMPNAFQIHQAWFWMPLERLKNSCNAKSGR